jgi:Protein of unknown function (DUF2971)
MQVERLQEIGFCLAARSTSREWLFNDLFSESTRMGGGQKSGLFKLGPPGLARTHFRKIPENFFYLCSMRTWQSREWRLPQDHLHLNARKSPRGARPFDLSADVPRVSRDANIGKLPETLAARPTPVRRASDGELAEELFAASELMTAQLELIHDYNHETPPEARAFKFLTRDFPTSYVRALDELIHPPWHAACFVADPANASMWATYGEAHRGVCLKFKTVPDSASRPALNLNVIDGWRGGQGKEMEPVRSFVPHAFHEVKYSESYPEIDFFNSIGRLPIPALNAFWYRSEDGERSACRAAPSCDTDAWRQQYWDAFYSGATCKTSEWAHEQEYLAVLQPA